MSLGLALWVLFVAGLLTGTLVWTCDSSLLRVWGGLLILAAVFCTTVYLIGWTALWMVR